MTEPAAPADPAAEPNLVEVRGATRRFGPVAALRPLNLTLAAGDHLLLAGPNGAGKTTLLRLLAGLARPQQGEVRVGGADPRRAAGARRRIGLLSHQPLVYDDLTCEENLRFFARLYGLDGGDETVAAALARSGLAERRDAVAGALSRGLKQRLALARATLHRPELLLLDEPFTGLDAGAAADLVTFLRTRAGEDGTASVLVTHRVTEVADLVNRVVVLDGGRRRCDRLWAGGDGDALQALCAAATAGRDRARAPA